MATKAAAPAASDNAPAPAAPAAPEAPMDPFAAAFQLMAKNEDDELAAAATAAAATDTEKPAAEAPALEKPAETPAPEKPAEGEVEAEKPAAEKPAEGEVETEKPAPEKPTESPDREDMLDRLAKLVKSAPAEEPQKPAVAQPQPEIISPEEKQFLETYEKDWPDVARAESIRRRAEYRDLVGFIFNEVAKEVKPIIDVVRTLSERTHLSDLTQAAPDYDQLRDNVIEWVKTQPAYLRSAYDHVISQGTAEEVGDLIGRYKQATGQPVGKPAAAPVAAKGETELPAATKKAVVSLAPVSSKRSAVVQPTDPQDFEGAFAAFAKEQNS